MFWFIPIPPWNEGFHLHLPIYSNLIKKCFFLCWYFLLEFFVGKFFFRTCTEFCFYFFRNHQDNIHSTGIDVSSNQWWSMENTAVFHWLSWQLNWRGALENGFIPPTCHHCVFNQTTLLFAFKINFAKTAKYIANVRISCPIVVMAKKVLGWTTQNSTKNGWECCDRSAIGIDCSNMFIFLPTWPRFTQYAFCSRKGAPWFDYRKTPWWSRKDLEKLVTSRTTPRWSCKNPEAMGHAHCKKNGSKICWWLPKLHFVAGQIKDCYCTGVWMLA